jgi:hypothetical protein
LRKVTHHIREQQYQEGTHQRRKGRKNHNDVEVRELLAVPRYHAGVDAGNTNLSDSEADSDSATPSMVSTLVKSKAAWRKQLAQWQEAEQATEGLESDAEDQAPPETTNRRQRLWLPRTLKDLFGGTVSRPITRQPPALDDESRLMEHLQAEYSDEPMDDGELEGSGDDFEG